MLDSSHLIMHRLTRPRTASTQEIWHRKHELAEYAATIAAAVLRRHNGIQRSHSIMPRELLRSCIRTLDCANSCILLAHTTVNNASTPRMACCSSSSHQNAARRHVDQADHHANMNGTYMDGRTVVGHAEALNRSLLRLTTRSRKSKHVTRRGIVTATSATK